MALLKKKKAAPAARPEPTHEQRLSAALSRRAGAEGLVAAGATGLASVAVELDDVAKSAFDEAARLSVIGNQATSHSAKADERATAATALLS